ncbi:MAG: hypothetical protein K2R98_08105 [Gemmataceae bacterium]|nr:hypothetical protein [Gemmataceae bacterium]
MMDRVNALVVKSLAVRMGRSLLQYASDAYPWSSADEGGALTEIERMIRAEQKATASLILWLQRHHLPLPYFGPYPENFTRFNFVSLDYLLAILADHEQQATDATKRDLALLTDPEAIGLVQKVLEMDEQHVEVLKKLAAQQQPEPAAK